LVILDLAMPKMTGGDLLNDVHHVVAEVVLCFRNVCFRRCTSGKSLLFWTVLAVTAVIVFGLVSR